MSDSNIAHKYASVAQSVEQGTENPRVGGSIPPRGTKAKDRDRAGVAQLAEQLICNQQVAGSIPVTSSNKGRFPSGQREQTVNLPTMSSVVRIHPFPPHANRRLFGACLRVVGRGGLTNHGPKRAWFGDPRSGRFREVAANLLSKTKSGKRTSTHLTRGTKFMVPAFCAEKGWIYEPRRFSAWFGCPPQAAPFAKLLPIGSRRRKAGSEPPPPYKRHPIMGAFFSGGKGWITEPRRFSAWFGCPPKAAAFAKLLPTGSRRRKAGSEPPPHIRTSL